MSNEILTQIMNTLVEGKPDETVELTRKALTAGIEPMQIISKGLTAGMDIVGERFQTGEFFLPNLVIAASGMDQAMEILKPELESNQQAAESLGTVVIGSVAGDIHEIGKSLVATMLSVNGFEVHDLGVDVANEIFVAKVKETGAKILGLSALLTTTMTIQRQIINELEEAGIREEVKVIIGGAPISQEWADTIGADGYAEDAIGAVELAKRLIS
jgi:5-methyltetrahydrofolate--homocysteine methyltransferase